jgi:hypothetical protein
MRRKTSQELNKLSQRVAEWRAREGGRGSRIPDELWNDAVGVARDVGVWATAKALRFNYEALRDRVKQAGGGEAIARASRAATGGRAIATRVKPGGDAPKETAGPSFVALELGQLCSGGRTVIELVGRHGDRMRVELAGGVDVVGLAQVLWSQQP